MALFSKLQNKTNAHKGYSFLPTPGKIKKTSELGLKRMNLLAFLFANSKCGLCQRNKQKYMVTLSLM
jgi:hypothetical protein